MILKWGICCAGLISQDFTSAFHEFPNTENKITAVAARSKERAKNFALQFNIENYFDCYEKLAEFDDVDIIYVGSIHPEHCKLTKLFLNHGKHVLVEKPMAMNATETKELIDLAREKKLFLMEGIWSLFFPLYIKIQQIVLNKEIGDLKHANANFQVNCGNVDRLIKKELGGGGLLDIGIYVLQFALWVFRGRELVNATSNIKWNEDVDIYGSILLEFENNGTAFLTYHTSVDGDTSASVYGSAGKIIIPKNMWCPEEVIINEKLENMFKIERKDKSFTYNFKNSWYFIHEINHVKQCIENGLLESDIHPLKASLEVAEIMEKILKK